MYTTNTYDKLTKDVQDFYIKPYKIVLMKINEIYLFKYLILKGCKFFSKCSLYKCYPEIPGRLCGCVKKIESQMEPS